MSWVVVANLSRDSLTVSATLLRDSGAELAATLQVGPRARTGREVGAWFGLAPGVDTSDSLEVACSVLCAVSVIGWDVSGSTLINPTPMQATPVCGF